MDYAVETFDLTKAFRIPTEASKAPYYHMWVTGLKDVLVYAFMDKKLKKFPAVDHVNIKIGDGEFFGLLGPNGAGKTTLIKLLCTLLKPDEGTALVNGYDILEDTEMVRRSVNMVAGTRWTGFYLSLTVRENLDYFASLYGYSGTAARKKVDEILGVVGLSEKADSGTMHLSSGMRQRLVIGRGLLVETPLFFLDEPTIGLDPEGAHNVREFMSNLNRELHKTMILTTHYMREAEALCDRVAIMTKGRIIACDTPTNLKKLVPKETITEIYATNIPPDLSARLSGLESFDRLSCEIEDPTIGSGKIRIHAKHAETAIGKAMTLLEKEKITIRYIKREEPTLEDVFLHLTSRSLSQPEDDRAAAQ